MAVDVITDFLELLNIFSPGRGRLPEKLFVHDFWRNYEGYVASEPIVFSLTGGFIAFIKVRGLDPESFGPDTVAEAAAAVSRAFNGFRKESMAEDFRGGYWEVMNFFVRSRGASPGLARPTTDNATLEFLWEKANRFWEREETWNDEIVFTVHYSPRFVTVTDMINFESPMYFASLTYPIMNCLCRAFKNIVYSFLNDLNAFVTMRPKLGIGASWMEEDEVHRFLYRFINKNAEEPLPYDPDGLLVNQVCSSERVNAYDGYYISDRRCDVLTFKSFPTESRGNMYLQIVENCRFPFAIVQIFNTLDPEKVLKKNALNVKFAYATEKLQASSERYIVEGRNLEDTVNNRGNLLWRWKFACVILGDSQHQLEDRSQKVKSYLKSVYSCEPMSEPRKTRAYAEIGTIPGNGHYNVREIAASSENAGDACFIFKRDGGAEEGDIIFGDRIGGTYKYAIFDSALPSWNFALLGLTGSGKSLLMNMMVVALVSHPHQVYVIDKGNSYGTLFKELQDAKPDAVAIMRVSSDDFRFNPLPLVSAIRKRREQMASGTYRMALGDGGVLDCPVEMAKVNFAFWVEILLGDGKEFTPKQKNALDLALNGEGGHGGFFSDYEWQCQQYVERSGGACARFAAFAAVKAGGASRMATKHKGQEPEREVHRRSARCQQKTCRNTQQ